MHLPNLIALAALASSLLLLFQLRERVFPITAVVASGLEVLFGFNVVHFSIHGLNLVLVLGAALAVAGVFLWLRTRSKHHTTASTVIAFVGAMQVLGVLLR
jgi:hypothetical protein